LGESEQPPSCHPWISHYSNTVGYPNPLHRRAHCLPPLRPFHWQPEFLSSAFSSCSSLLPGSVLPPKTRGELRCQREESFYVFGLLLRSRSVEGITSSCALHIGRDLTQVNKKGRGPLPRSASVPHHLHTPLPLPKSKPRRQHLHTLCAPHRLHLVYCQLGCSSCTAPIQTRRFARPNTKRKLSLPIGRHWDFNQVDRPASLDTSVRGETGWVHFLLPVPCAPWSRTRCVGNPASAQRRRPPTTYHLRLLALLVAPSWPAPGTTSKQFA